MTFHTKFDILYTDKREETLKNLERKKMNKLEFLEEIVNGNITEGIKEFAKILLEKESETEERKAEVNAKKHADQLQEETLLLNAVDQGRTLTTFEVKQILASLGIKETKSTSILKRLVDKGQVVKGYEGVKGGKPKTTYTIV